MRQMFDSILELIDLVAAGQIEQVKPALQIPVHASAQPKARVEQGSCVFEHTRMRQGVAQPAKHALTAQTGVRLWISSTHTHSAP